MITSFCDKVVVKIKYNGNEGSGVLISDIEEKNSYLISAWHCFDKQMNIDYGKIETLRQEENILKNVDLSYNDKIVIEQSDIIIFELDYVKDVPQYQIINPELEEKVFFAGFPNGLSGEECMTSRYIARGEINEFPNDSIIQVNCDRGFETYSNDAINNISGYSGCGLFLEHNENMYLCGIITMLGSPDGLFSFVNGISISAIENALYQAKKIHLPDTKWCSFEKFSKATLKIFDEPLANICSVQIPEIVGNVTPKRILEHCGNKIVWPYSNASIHRNEVWEEWLLYLIIRCIENRDNIKNEDFYLIKNEEKNRKVKVLYATNHTTLPEFLKDYLVNAYQDISNGQVMIVKTDEIPANTKISSKKIDQIVSNIGYALSEENHVYIDEVESNIRQMSIIHIRELIDEMTNFVEQEESGNLTMQELEKKLGGRIMEVLYGI